MILYFLLIAYLSFVSAAGAESQYSDSRIDNFGRVYKNSSDPLLQELWLLGRYHGQYYWSRGSTGDDNDYESRRVRYGFQAKMFDKFTLHAQAIAGSDFSPSYNGFSELWAQWAFDPAFVLTVGQQKHRFTHDRNVSSRYINYLERSMLTNMFAADYTPAVTLQGEKTGGISYYAGIFSNATGKNIGEALSELDSGYSLLGAVYDDITDVVKTDSAYLHATYLYSDANQNATNLDRFNNGFSSAFIMTEDAYSFVAELTAGIDKQEGNAYGINIQPGWFLTDKLQLVGRYQFAFSNSENGLNPQQRYEQTVNLPEGDRYNAAYLGFNYYLLGHRVKLMQGVEYANMSGEHVWTISAMLRVYFGPHTNGAFPLNRVLPGAFWDSD